MPQSPVSGDDIVIKLNYKLVLVGEDDLDDQELLKEVFTSIDDSFLLLFAINGTEVLAHLEKCPNKDLPCLIVLDYNMPGSNGAEILKELKNNPRYNTIPKIIWSTSGSATYKDICMKLGANEYLVKPSRVNELVDICRYMLSTCQS
ncbi:MAG: response regulator [Bacteroidota bacterium]